MCGRFVSVSSPKSLADTFGVTEQVLPEHEPEYNVSPRAGVLVVRDRPPDDEGHPDVARVLSLVRWGLVPSWAKDVSMGDRMINARAETVASKPAYRRAFAKRRCIVPVDAFYEWKASESAAKRAAKQPYLIRRRDGAPLACAGLWETWRDPAVDDPDDPHAWVRSCTIITTRPNGVLAPIHDRMPVVLDASAWDEWLDPANHDVGALESLLVPAPDDWVEAYPVSTRVNNPRNHGAELVDRVET